MVEEEIPPSWQVETPLTTMASVDADRDEVDAGNAVEAVEEMDADMTEEPPPPTPIRFAEEHLQLIFELRQKMDDHAHIQKFLGQCLDLLMDAMTVAPASKRCPTRGQFFVPAYNAQGRLSPS
jgi:hypothetical protein